MREYLFIIIIVDCCCIRGTNGYINMVDNSMDRVSGVCNDADCSPEGMCSLNGFCMNG
jgi:hypothetical protein